MLKSISQHYISTTLLQPGVNESARKARHERVLAKIGRPGWAASLRFPALLTISNSFSQKSNTIKSLVSPYLNFHKGEIETNVSVSRKLFRRYTALVALLFLIGSFTPIDSVSGDSYSTQFDTLYDGGFDTALVADSEGYLTKISPQTNIGDRSGMNDRLAHTVSSGETISTIAAGYGLKTQTLLWENGLNANSKLKIGQKLIVPPVDGVNHKVSKGENIEKLAKAYGVNADAIKKQNALVASTLTIGQEIYIPGGKPIAVNNPATARVTPARVASSTRVNSGAVASSGGAILPDSKDVPVGDKPFIFPTRGKLTQGFRPGHYAYDIGDRSQPPIWSAGSGTVIKAASGCARVSYGCGGGYGNHVIIDHGNGLQTLYAHMEYVSVKVGDKVSQGEVLGKMGRTGNVRGATGIHLHFEVRQNGKKMVPSKYY